MATAAERQALLFLTVLALVGGAVRVVGVQRFRRELAQAEPGGGQSATLGDRALTAQLAAVDSARQAPRAKGKSRAKSRATAQTAARGRPPPPSALPSDPPPPLVVEINDATAADLERLPRVGPALAARIVAYRDTHGPFASLDDLRHVRGIGPATARLLQPLVTFSGRHSPIQREAPASPNARAPYLH